MYASLECLCVSIYIKKGNPQQLNVRTEFKKKSRVHDLLIMYAVLKFQSECVT